jgi:hypothetical protein
VGLAVDRFLDSLPADVLAIGSVEALNARIASRNPLLVDLRSPADYRRGHIPAAINLPSRVSPTTWRPFPAIATWCSTAPPAIARRSG